MLCVFVDAKKTMVGLTREMKVFVSPEVQVVKITYVTLVICLVVIVWCSKKNEPGIRDVAKPIGVSEPEVPGRQPGLADVASIMEVQVGTVKSRLHTAKQKLSSILKSLGGKDDV